MRQFVTVLLMFAPLVSKAQNGPDPNSVANVLMVRSNNVLCTGTLVSPRLVLTAAHCLRDAVAEEIEVVVGTGTQGQRPYALVSTVTLPPQSTQGIDHTPDVALLTLKEAGALTPRLWARATVANPGSVVRVLGYGQVPSTKTDLTLQGSLKVTHQTIINPIPYDLQIDAGQFAVLGDYLCHGDSGGPAINEQDTVLGIVSFVLGDCIGPTVLVKNDAFSEWLTTSVAALGDPLFGVDVASADSFQKYYPQTGCQIERGMSSRKPWAWLIALFWMIARRLFIRKSRFEVNFK